MYYLERHIKKIVVQDFLHKYRKKNTKNLPSFKKLTLSSKFNETNKEAVLALFEVLSFNKAYLTVSKVNTLTLNLRKGDLVGCKLVLKKQHIYEFLDRFLFEILGSSKNFEGFKIKKSYIDWQLKNVFVLEDVNLIFRYLQNTSTFDISILAKNANPNFFQICRFPWMSDRAA